MWASIKRTILSHHVYESVPIKLQLDDEEMARFAVHRYEFTGVDIRTRLVAPLSVRSRWPCTRSATSPPSASRISSASIRMSYAGTTLIGKLGVEGAYENELHGTPRLPRSAGECGRQAGGAPGCLHAQARNASAHCGGRSDPESRHARATRRRRSACGQTRRGHRHRSAHRRCHCPRQHPGLRSQRLCARSHYQTIRCAAKRHRQAADQPRPARRLSARLDRQAVFRAGRIEIRRHDRRNKTIFCPGHFSLPGSSHLFRDWKPKGHGTVSMRHAIMQSCDVYFYTSRTSSASTACTIS